jgi:hypothetical protein
MRVLALLCAFSGAAAAIKREEVSALSPGADPSTCVANEGTGVTEKWCSNNCANVPPNCPASLCTCGDAAPELRAAVASPSPAPAPATAAAPEPAPKVADSPHPDGKNATQVKKANGSPAQANNATAAKGTAGVNAGKANAPNANKGNAANAGKASAAKGAAAKAEESKKAGNAATKAAVKPGSAGKDCKTAPCQVHCPFNEKCAKVLKEKEKKLGEEKHHPPAAKAAPAAKADAKKPAHGGCDKDPCQDFCPANAGCTKKQITKTNPPAAKAAAAAKKGPR